jgi:hypothetical protein
MHQKILLLSLIVAFNFSFSQTKTELEMLIKDVGLTTNSIYITSSKSYQTIASYGSKVLPKLFEHFDNKTPSNTWFNCKKEVLTLGELAVLIAHQIAPIPKALYLKTTSLYSYVPSAILTYELEQNPDYFF